MFDHDSWVTILFRFLNFLVVLGVIAYICKRYIYDMLESYVAQELNTHKSLEEKESLLESQVEDYNNQILAQHTMCHDLRLKAHIWRDAVDRQAHEMSAEHQKAVQAMRARRQAQVENVHYERHRQEIFHDALNQARKNLIAQHENSSENNTYVAQIIQAIKGRSS